MGSDEHEEGVKKVLHELAFSSPAPKTYADGLAEGKRIAFEASCKEQCTQCKIGIPYANGWHLHSDDGAKLLCNASGVRRAAQQFGVELSTPGAQEENK